jgi:hypothetical protein
MVGKVNRTVIGCKPPALNSASSGSVAAGKTQPLSSTCIYPLIDRSLNRLRCRPSRLEHAINA